MNKDIFDSIGEKIAHIHKDFLETQLKSHQLFLETRRKQFDTLFEKMSQTPESQMKASSDSVTLPGADFKSPDLETKDSSKHELPSSLKKPRNFDQAKESKPFTENTLSHVSHSSCDSMQEPDPKPLQVKAIDWRILYQHKHIQSDVLRDYWQRSSVHSHLILEDLLLGLTKRFIKSIKIEDENDFAAQLDQPQIFICNQQVNLEKILLHFVLAPILSKPLAIVVRKNHMRPWLAQFLQAIGSYLAPECQAKIFYFEPRLPRNVKKLHLWLDSCIKEGHPVLLPVLNSVGKGKETRLNKLGKELVHFANDHHFQMIPVHLFGGLPSYPIDKYLDFPYGMSKQNISIRTSVASKDLNDLPSYRKEAYIKDLLKNHDDHTLIEPDEKFGRLIHNMMLNSGLKVENALLLCILKELSSSQVNASSDSSEVLKIFSKEKTLDESVFVNDPKKENVLSFVKYLLTSK